MKIALIGKMCSGKSTVAQYLRDKYNYTILSFGGPVKKYATEIFDLKHKDRQIIQDFAQKVREIDDEVWIKYLIREYKNCNSENVVVDDVRFPKEHAALINEDFIPIKIDISDDFQRERIIKTYPENYQIHLDRTKNISESYIDKLSYRHKFTSTKDLQDNIFLFIENIKMLYDNGNMK